MMTTREAVDSLRVIAGFFRALKPLEDILTKVQEAEAELLKMVDEKNNLVTRLETMRLQIESGRAADKETRQRLADEFDIEKARIQEVGRVMRLDLQTEENKLNAELKQHREDYTQEMEQHNIELTELEEKLRVASEKLAAVKSAMMDVVRTDSERS